MFRQSYYGEFKNGGLLGKKNKVALHVYENYIRGNCAKLISDSFHMTEFYIEYKYIIKMEKQIKDGMECLIMECVDKNSILQEAKFEIYFPNLEKIDNAMECIQQNINEIKAEAQKKREREERRELEEKQKKELCEKFYADCYEFHISKDDNPYYELQSSDLMFACIYVDKNKNLNFLKIDGNCKEENNAYISYDKIHYYERAGSIHCTKSLARRLA